MLDTLSGGGSKSNSRRKSSLQFNDEGQEALEN